MLEDIVEYAYDNHAYIRPNDDLPNKLIGFKCNVSDKQWQISIKNFESTKTETESILIKNVKVRSYFCRAASCKMYNKFEMKMRIYLKTKKWFSNLEPEEKRYIHLVRKYLHLKETFN